MCGNIIVQLVSKKVNVLFILVMKFNNLLLRQYFSSSKGYEYDCRLTMINLNILKHIYLKKLLLIISFYTKHQT